MDAISIALSGLKAQGTKTAVSAGNIANASSNNYTPKDAVLTSGEAGVSVDIKGRDNPSVKTYSPPSALADAEGFVSVPNISMEEEIMNIMTAEIAYKANISVIKTADEMQESMLDTLI